MKTSKPGISKHALVVAAIPVGLVLVGGAAWWLLPRSRPDVQPDPMASQEAPVADKDEIMIPERKRPAKTAEPLTATDPKVASADFASTKAIPPKPDVGRSLQTLYAQFKASSDPEERREIVRRIKERITPDNKAEIDELIASLNPEEPDKTTNEPGRPGSKRQPVAMRPLETGKTSEAGLIGKPLEQLLENDFEKALDLIYKTGSANWNAGNVLMRQATEWATASMTIEEQLSWVEDLPDGPMKGSAAGLIIEQWGQENAITSLQWALSMEDPGARGSALSAAFAKWATGVGGGDPNVGAEMIDNLESPRDRDFALNGYASALVGTQPELALEIAESISMPGLRAAAVNRITQQISRMTQPGQNP